MSDSISKSALVDRLGEKAQEMADIAANAAGQAVNYYTGMKNGFTYAAIMANSAQTIEPKHARPFSVIDKETGKEADTYQIALYEEWAEGLIYCDMDGFAIMENGDLVLLDECGRFAYCPPDRFEVRFEEESEE